MTLHLAGFFPLPILIRHDNQDLWSPHSQKDALEAAQAHHPDLPPMGPLLLTDLLLGG